MKKHKTIVFLVILSILFNGVTTGIVSTNAQSPDQEGNNPANSFSIFCLLYTSDAADDLPCVDLGGRRIIKKTKQNEKLDCSF